MNFNLKNNKSVFALILIPIVLLIIGGAIVLSLNLGNSDNQKYTYTEMLIKPTGSNDLYAILSIDDGKLVYESRVESNIDGYIELRIPFWESSQLKFEKDDREQYFTDSTKPDFLEGVYYELYNRWDGYAFELR